MNIAKNPSIRPQRISITDTLGRKVTLQSGAEAFWVRGILPLSSPAPVLVLGTGADLTALTAWLTSTFSLGSDTAIFWLDAPRVHTALQQALPRFTDNFPQHWQPVSRLEAYRLLSTSRICWFRQNCRLDNAFWAPLHGHLLAMEHGILFQKTSITEENDTCGSFTAAHSATLATPAPQEAILPCKTDSIPHAMLSAETYQTVPTAALCTPPSREVLLPGASDSLLIQELSLAFCALGFRPRLLPSKPDTRALASMLATCSPALFCSLNLRGFDAEGGIFHMLKACGIPCAAWLVDNPWHLLSGISQPWWQDLPIFVTDDSFLPALTAHGARHVHHLPLAAAQHMWKAGSRQSQPSTSQASLPFLFVGSSHFPHKEQFFAAARVPDDLLQHALSLARAGKRPDALWWQDHLHETLWPGHGARRVGLGAEMGSQTYRAAWLNAALPLGLTVYGDDGWRDLLPPHTNLLPPVDYYTTLPNLYRDAAITLNVTSLLLPHGLTQRHFDVWAAGGLLLSDDTPGLQLFPKELTSPITVEHPDCLAKKLAFLSHTPALQKNLRQAWRDELYARHTYPHRLERLLQILQTDLSLYENIT